MITIDYSLENKRDCFLCTLSRDSPIGKVSNKKNHDTTEKIKCTKCFVTIKKGILHKCNVKSQLQNIKKGISNLPMKRQENLVSSIVHDFKNRYKDKNNCSTSSELNLSHQNGKFIKIDLNSKQQKPIFSAEDMSKIKNEYNFSMNSVLKLVGDLRIGSCNRQIIKPNLKNRLKLKKEDVEIKQKLQFIAII